MWLKCVWMNKWVKIAKKYLKEKERILGKRQLGKLALLDIKTDYKITITKTIFYWHENSQVHKWN